MNNLGALMDAQRRAERDFVREAAAETAAPNGRTAALMMFHLARWRGRLLQAMSEHAGGRPFDPPTGSIDEFNDAELPAGARLTLAEVAADSDSASARCLSSGPGRETGRSSGTWPRPPPKH